MIAEAQRQVAEFVADQQLQSSPEARLIDLTSELGELGKEWLKSSSYGARPFSVTAGWGEEMGDVLFALICLANSTEVDLDTALESALAKYRFRMIRYGDVNSDSELTAVKEDA